MRKGEGRNGEKNWKVGKKSWKERERRVKGEMMRGVKSETVVKSEKTGKGKRSRNKG